MKQCLTNINRFDKMTTDINIDPGCLVKTKIGIYGVIHKFNKKDDLYTIFWSAGLRKGESVNYQKKTLEHLIDRCGWILFSHGDKPQ